MTAASPATHRRRAPLQPLLHAADRRAAQKLSRQPLLARRNARALRARAWQTARAPPATSAARSISTPAIFRRVLRNFEKRGLITRKTSRARRPPKPSRADRARAKSLRAARKALAGRRRAPCSASSSPTSRRSWWRRCRRSRRCSTASRRASAKPAYILRAPRHGDFGWIVSRHAELYAQEYGWGEPFEGLCAQIVADFVNNYDAELRALLDRRDERRERRLRHAGEGLRPSVARMRLLLVDPKARGLGPRPAAGRRMRHASRAQAGYKKITLWTHSILTAARHVYEKAGFTLTSSEQKHSWGKDVVAEYWDLDVMTTGRRSSVRRRSCLHRERPT